MLLEFVGNAAPALKYVVFTIDPDSDNDDISGNVSENAIEITVIKIIAVFFIILSGFSSIQ
jgi:hypothetical protein